MGADLPHARMSEITDVETVKGVNHMIYIEELKIGPLELRSLDIRLKFEPRDLWIGIYWNTLELCGLRRFDIYFTLIPCFPLNIRAVRDTGSDTTS